MSLYTGCDCPSCGKLFVESDDVVVCPVCGSPQHRSCYKAMGHCGNEEYHAQGQHWERPQVQQEAAQAQAQPEETCPGCGTRNPAGNFFCQSCGQRMSAAAEQGTGGSFGQFMHQMDLNYQQELEKDVTVKDACDYVGSNYLPFVMKFKMIVLGSVTFNWSAFLFGYFYCFYRKMYKPGVVLLVISMLALLPTIYFSTLALKDMLDAGVAITIPPTFVTDSVNYRGLVITSSIFRLVSLAQAMFCGLMFNKLYYQQMVDGIKQVKGSGKASTGTQECSYAIAAQGGVNRTALVVLAASVFVAYTTLMYLITTLVIL